MKEVMEPASFGKRDFKRFLFPRKIHSRVRCFLLCSWIAFLWSALPVLSQSATPSRKASVSLEVGNWQPQSLNSQPRFSTFGNSGATPLYLLGVSFPLGRDTGFRLSAGFWSLRDLAKTDSVHSLALHSMHADFKYWLVPDFRLSAYVLYGGGVYWGVENERAPFGKRLRKAKPGWGANLGAGFDLALSRRIGMGMVFQYHFIRFQRELGGVDDFSGPKIGAGIFYFL